MVDSIVWACDGRSRDHADVEYVHRLCRVYGCRLWIVHVARANGAGSFGSDGSGAAHERAIERLKSHTRSLRDRGTDASLQVIRGADDSTAEAIVALARDVAADLLVVGADRPRARRGSPPGAIAASLLATAECPVLWLGGPWAGGAERHLDMDG